MDYASYSSVVQWVEKILDGDGLNLLINNAAQMHSDGLQQVTRDVMMNELESNAVAPLIISQVHIIFCIKEQNKIQDSVYHVSL